VLPAWATVAVVLGGSALGALAGVVGSYFGLRGARLNIKHEEQQAWKSRLIEAAEQFLAARDNATKKITEAWREIAQATDEGSSGIDLQMLRKPADDAVLALVPTVIRVRLLFGVDSDAARMADEIYTYMVSLTWFDSPDPDGVANMHRAVEVGHNFLRAVHAAVAPSNK
jgi:hypothetical protein